MVYQFYSMIKIKSISILARQSVWLLTPVVYKPKPYLILYTFILCWQYKYLGCKICSDLSDKLDVRNQICNLYVRGNTKRKRFSYSSQWAKCLLFQSYCTNRYCSSLWANYPLYMISKIKVAYNMVFRMFMGYPRSCSASGMFTNNRLKGLSALLCSTTYHLLFRLLGQVKHVG